MKKIKLMALGLMVMMIQSVGAVTLPSTSYSPYAGGTYSSGSEGVVFSSGSLVSGSYSALGSYDVDACTTSEPGEPISPYTECSVCCYAEVTSQCEKEGGTNCDQVQLQCVNSCENGASLPLDGGLSILLVLALGSGAVRAFKRRK